MNMITIQLNSRLHYIPSNIEKLAQQFNCDAHRKESIVIVSGSSKDLYLLLSQEEGLDMFEEEIHQCFPEILNKIKKGL